MEPLYVHFLKVHGFNELLREMFIVGLLFLLCNANIMTIASMQYKK